MSFVFQNTCLFKTTLLENIMYGNPSASMIDVERAVCMARCGDIVDRLPLGLKTRIGAGGTIFVWAGIFLETVLRIFKTVSYICNRIWKTFYNK